MTKALVTRIVKDSILDGPGCRYVVFLKGCHLACPWCHNPETQSSTQEIMVDSRLCIKCKKCLDVSPQERSFCEMPLRIDNRRWEKYAASVAACPTNALEYAAKEYTAQEIITNMQKYITIYSGTKGGITLSGGEPLLKEEFVLDIFHRAKELNIHTALDTTFSLPWEIIKNLLSVVDLWLIDIKHSTDTAIQAKTTISNLLKLTEQKNVSAWIRVPIIPNYNDTANIWRDMAIAIKPAQGVIHYIDLLPFHPYGATKYQALNRPYAFASEKPLDLLTLQKAQQVFAEYFPLDKIRLGREIVNG